MAFLDETGLAHVRDLVREDIEAAQLEGKDGKDGTNGVTFTPSLDTEGNLSWTNDGGLDNPETVNIKGPKGDNAAAVSQGWGFCATITRDAFTEAEFTTYGTIGHDENWSKTESIRNGCRIGDLFIIVGSSTDEGKAHMLIYRSDTDSGTLHGICEGHLTWG